MGTLLSYSAIAAKLRAMQSRLIGEEQLREILQLENVNQVMAYLKKTPGYEGYFSEIDETRIHRGDMEKLLRQTVFLDFVKLYRFSDKEQKAFLELYAKKYDIYVLKAFFTRLFDPNKEQVIDVSLYRDFFSRHSRLDLDRLSSCTDEPSLLEALKGTEYYAPLKAVQGLDPLIFDDGMALDVYYFTQIWNIRKKLFSGTDLEELTVTYGEKFDLLNMQFIYRSKKYYNLPAAAIYSILIPVNYKLSREDIQSMVEAASAEEALQLFGHTWYGKKFNRHKDITLEEFYSINLQELLEREARRHPYSVAILFRYLYSKEQEVRRLTLALEAVRYQMPPEEAMRYIQNT